MLRHAQAVLTASAAGFLIVWGLVVSTVMSHTSGPSPAALSLQGAGLVLAIGTAFGISWTVSPNRLVASASVGAVIAFACLMFGGAY